MPHEMSAREYIQSFHDRLAIARSMEVRSDEYLDHMTFVQNRRPLFTEIFGPLVGLKEEWSEQGATDAELDLSAFPYRRPAWGMVPVNTGWHGGPEPVILEETDDLLVGKDEMGRTFRLSKKAATLPLPADHPVRSHIDWKRIRARYEYTEDRFCAGWEDSVRRLRAEGKIVTVRIPGGYDEPRQLMGDEGLLLAYYDQPDLVHEILQTIGETALRVLDRVTSLVQVDELFVHEDMAGATGPLIGPKQVNEFIKPYYRPIWDLLHSRGVRIFRQDSDGDMRPVIPAFLEAGVNLMYPIEPAAGMDIVALRREYGTQLAYMGGLDKHVLRRGQDAIRAELEYKIPPLVRSGGAILGLDHRIPNGTTLAAYRYYIECAWEILQREGAKL